MPQKVSCKVEKDRFDISYYLIFFKIFLARE